HLADALGVQREAPDGQVAVLGRLDHAADRLDLAVRQPLRHGSRTTGSIIERADFLGPDPDVEPSRRQPQHSESRRQRHGPPGSLDRAEQASPSDPAGATPPGTRPPATRKRLLPAASGTRARSSKKPEPRSRASTSRRTAVNIA